MPLTPNCESAKQRKPKNFGAAFEASASLDQLHPQGQLQGWAKGLSLPQNA
jgi:hypothetical protein